MQLRQCTTIQEWDQLPMRDLEPKKKQAQCASYVMCFSRLSQADALGANAVVPMLQSKVCVYVCVHVNRSVLQ
jgi:hypothetical protein